VLGGYDRWKSREVLMFRIIKRAPWIAIGAGAAWLFDPERGPIRRQQAKEKLKELVGSNGRQLEEPGTTDPYVAGTVTGATGTG
jgi:hypothetical protein